MNCKNNWIILKPAKSQAETSAGIKLPDLPENEIAVWTGTVVSSGVEDLTEGQEIAYSKVMSQAWKLESNEYAVVEYRDVIAVL